MANRKISALAALTGANLAVGDRFKLLDISEAADADKNKTITTQELITALSGLGSGLSIGRALALPFAML